MRTSVVLLFAASLWQEVASSFTYGGCTDGITCQDIAANGLVFQCRFAGQPDYSGQGKNVMMLHGFPEWSDMCAAIQTNTACSSWSHMLETVGHHPV
jgi:hypothetical protein